MPKTKQHCIKKISITCIAGNWQPTAKFPIMTNDKRWILLLNVEQILKYYFPNKQILIVCQIREPTCPFTHTHTQILILLGIGTVFKSSDPNSDSGTFQFNMVKYQFHDNTERRKWKIWFCWKAITTETKKKTKTHQHQASDHERILC